MLCCSCSGAGRQHRGVPTAGLEGQRLPAVQGGRPARLQVHDRARGTGGE